MTPQGQRARRSLAAISSLLLLVGCGMMGTVEEKTLDTKMAVGTTSYVDRCVKLMRVAYPDVDFKVTDQHFTVGANIEKAVVDVEGAAHTGADMNPAQPVAAQCRFENGIIVDFHWTKSPVA